MNNNVATFSDVKQLITFVESRKRFSEKTSLDKMNYLLSIFNHPERSYPTIHITGTNGKGSTVAMLRNIFFLQGIHVASFTSPYVLCFNERIWYNGHNISDEDLLKYGNIILSKYDKIIQDGFELPTFFEFITLLAFLYFSEIKDLDLAIIEVGIGGRLDSTNVIDPILSAITNVTLEHTKQLGNTLTKITQEKLGIVKQNKALITSCKDLSLQEQMSKRCNELNAKFIKCNYDLLNVIKCDLEETIFDYKEYKNIKLSLSGAHQIENAMLVIDIVDYCNNFWIKNKSNLHVFREVLYEGLITCYWPGRLELVSTKPLIYLDGGHNIDCIKRIAEFVQTIPCTSKLCVVAISHDKDKEQMISMLDNTFDELVFTKYTYKRSETASELFDLSKATNKVMIDNLDEVVNYVKNANYSFNLFIGSLYLISEVKNKYFK